MAGRSARVFRARITYALGRQQIVHTADGGIVATGWKQKVILVVLEVRSPEYRRDPPRPKK